MICLHRFTSNQFYLSNLSPSECTINQECIFCIIE